VKYLGYKIDAEGLHPVEEKVKAIRDAPSPKNVTELKSYLGLLSYYGRFLPHLPSVLAPLYKLLRHDTPWRWTSKEKASFAKSKELLTSSQVLVHFDPKLELILACDASAYGIGAVLAHKMSDLKDQLDLRREPYLRPKKIIRKLKKVWHVYLA
jgi:hypothetical protein